MTGSPRYLRFAWWNLHNFAHFDPNRSGVRRWPERQAHYEAKRGRILNVIRQMVAPDLPDLIAVCEITRQAADDLLSHLQPDFVSALAPPRPHEDDFQVAVFFRRESGFTPEPPILPTEGEDLSRGTRAMVPLHLTLPGHVFRFVACHWTGLDEESSQVARQRLADVLRRDVYSFLRPGIPTPGVVRHAVVLGDLNEEPMSPVFEQRLIGRRDRASSHDRHWQDADVRRVRLYNAAWRYLGERTPHGPSATGESIAGTYFRPPHEWRTYDHLLVSCGLLGPEPPYFDESQTGVFSAQVLLGAHGVPRPFEAESTHGVSDHFPIVGRFVLPEASK